MKIVTIFDDRLYAIQYQDKFDNEFDRLLELWSDVTFLFAFAKKNHLKNIPVFINKILLDVEQVQDFLESIEQYQQPFRFYFEPLQNSEQKKVLAFHKGKIKQNQLRFYAIKIDENCFLITGGAIKMSQKMMDHPDTAIELVKLKKVKEYLIQNGVFDDASFFELIIE